MKKKTIILFLVIVSYGYCQNIKDVWNSISSMNHNRAFHTMAVGCNKMYVFGGSTGDNNEFKDLTSVEMYDPELKKWIPKTDMPEVLTTSCAVTVGDKIYIVGGQQNRFESKVKKVLMYDCSLDSWEYKSSMKIARAFHSVVALNNKIYAIGGRENNTEINTKEKDSLAVYTIEEYDLLSDKWIVKKILPFKHYSIAAVTLNDKIYILSDTTSNRMLGHSAILEEYDPINSTLKLRTELKPSKCDVGIAVYKNKIYVFGGWYKNSLSTIEEYDLINDKWSEKTNMPYKIQNHQAISYDDKIYISGGIIYQSGGNQKKYDVLVYNPDND